MRYMLVGVLLLVVVVGGGGNAEPAAVLSEASGVSWRIENKTRWAMVEFCSSLWSWHHAAREDNGFVTSVISQCESLSTTSF